MTPETNEEIKTFTDAHINPIAKRALNLFQEGMEPSAVCDEMHRLLNPILAKAPAHIVTGMLEYSIANHLTNLAYEQSLRSRIQLAIDKEMNGGGQ